MSYVEIGNNRKIRAMLPVTALLTEYAQHEHNQCIKSVQRQFTFVKINYDTSHDLKTLVRSGVLSESKFGNDSNVRTIT